MTNKRTKKTPKSAQTAVDAATSSGGPIHDNAYFKALLPYLCSDFRHTEIFED